jgi:hypothetical protein
MLKRMYECRSQAAHSGHVSPSTKLKGQKIPVSEFLREQGAKFCSQAITHIIANGGFSDWESLVLGE